jgi:hypothetical protein
MRAFALTLLLCACSTDGLPPGGGTSGGTTGGGLRDLSVATDLGDRCAPSCNHCPSGVCCGSGCCNSGEWCDGNQQCRCGNNAGCAGNLLCSSGGPVMVGGSQCGTICCGDAQHPCPL